MTNKITMTPNKPYLIRAYYDWIVDNNCTPYLLVNTKYPGVDIPWQFVVDDKILLDLSPSACRGLHLDNDKILFSARFSGSVAQLFIPPPAVLAIYAKETNEGINFPEEQGEPIPPSPNKPVHKKPILKLVK